MHRLENFKLIDFLIVFRKMLFYIVIKILLNLFESVELCYILLGSFGQITKQIHWSLESRTQSVPRGGSTFSLFDFPVKWH
jgi:hypothetical protein